MGYYNTFIVQRTQGGRAVLVTSSARKASRALAPGYRVEVWNSNEKVATVYARTRSLLASYIQAEKDYIGAKQAAAEKRNRARAKYANIK